MRSNTRKSMYSLSISKKKKLKKLKASLSPDEKVGFSNNKSDSYSNSDNDSEYDNDNEMNENNDTDNNYNYDNNSDLSSDLIIKKSKSKSKHKNLTSKKAKHPPKEEKENRNTINIQKTRRMSEDADNDEDVDEGEEEDHEGKEISFLPCREEEQTTIYNYIKEGLQTTGAYSSLYIAGMPGTGKTASLLTVIKKLQYESAHSQAKKTNRNTIPPFNHLYLNGMKIPNPNTVFKIIHNHIFSEQRCQNIKKYIQILDNFFRNREEFNYKTFLKDIKNSHLILIVDEVDCLINQKQNLLYNIFNWTTYNKSKLIVISISNTLNLPSKLLPKIQSRMGTNKLMFSPYLKNDLYKIISVKIDDVDMFSEDSLKFSCMKVAAVNGDLRRMLLICKRAKELFFREKERNKSIKRIEKSHIMQACKELFDSKLINVIQSLQLLEKIIIATILYRMKADDDIKIKVADLYDKKDIFLQKTDYSMNWEEFTSIIFNLISLKIISFTEGFKDNFINNYVCIKFYTDEFMNAVENDTSFKDILPTLQSLLNV